MAFEVVIQRNESETIALDKTLSTIATLMGTLREESSIINPSIIVEANLVDLKNANYLTVDSFGRSYFINDMTSIRNGLVQLSCHVDVLSSFASEIRANRGIIFRQEKNWNLYLNDGVIEVYQNPIVTTKEFPHSFEGESYVLALAGRRSGGIQPFTSGDNSKSSNGLAAYAEAQLGNPYWYGTFGQIASQSLYEAKKYTYPEYYTATDFPSQYGQRVHDCVGLVKGYRWSDTPTSVPNYVAGEDVNVQGLFGQCSSIMGFIGDSNWNTLYQAYKGICVFTRSLDHVGVYMGDGTTIEARGHAYGVVRTNNSSRNWYYYGIPDWLIDSISGIPVN